MKRYKSLIFDFDGTIADTLDESLRIYNDLAGQYNLLPVNQDDVADLRHMSLGRLFTHLGISKHRAPKLLYQGTRMLKSRIASLPLIQGMADTLPVLRNKAQHFGILTSNSVDNVGLFLESHGLDNLFTFVSSTSKLSGKARHLKSIQKSYQIAPEQMLYIGDEIRDIRAAKKAGVDMAAVSWGFNSQESLGNEAPDFLLTQPSELVSLAG